MGTKIFGTVSTDKAVEVGRNIYRPTSVVVMTLLFEGFQLIFPDVMDRNAVLGTYKILLALGTTGIIDKGWRNRKIILEFFKGLITKKEKENG